MVNADGTGRHAPGVCNIFGSPRISPDGTRVTNSVHNLANDLNDVHVTDFDGSDPVVIPATTTRHSSCGGRPMESCWRSSNNSPLSCCDNGFLHVERADGSGGTNATAVVNYTAAPAARIPVVQLTKPDLG